MTISPQDNVRATARELYEDGLALDAIARSVKVSVMSVLRWRRDDAEAGRPWLRPGEMNATEKIRLELQGHLAHLIEEARRPREGGRKANRSPEGRMLDVCRVIKHLDPDTDDPTIQLAVLKGFVAFCVRTLSEPDMPPLRKAIRLYLDDLKARHQ